MARDSFAGLPNDKSRTVESENGEYVLVLLKPPSARETLEEFSQYVEDIYGYRSQAENREWIEEFKQELALEAKYPTSGLYRNDGSTEPLWMISYISLCQDVVISNDGSGLWRLDSSENCLNV